MSIYDTLNKEQAAAVRQTEGPVLILAGAGSGKTRVITHRIAYLMDECGVNPWNILAITFTNKAAGEMRERVDDLIGFGAESVWISTFHSMCVRILRRHIELLGYEPSFTIYDTDDQKSLMKEICKYLKIDTKELREREILSEISSAKNELITPLQYREENIGVSFRNKRIADAYDEYQRRLRKNNAVDFDDLLMLTVELFHSHDEVLGSYQNRFRYIMVDEYQDTNNAQFELVRLLAGKFKIDHRARRETNWRRHRRSRIARNLERHVQPSRKFKSSQLFDIVVYAILTNRIKRSRIVELNESGTFPANKYIPIWVCI